MLLGAGGDHAQQEFEAVVRLDPAEIGAVRAELAKEGLVICGDPLADDGDSEARHGRRLRRHNRAQTIGVSERRGSKSIQLMGGPEMRGELFHKLAGGVDPIEIFELGGKTDLREASQPVLELFGRERVQVGQFFFQSAALGGKLEIVFNDFSQQAGQEAQRQALQRGNIAADQFPCFRRIAIELLRFEIGWKHKFTRVPVSVCLRRATWKIPAWIQELGRDRWTPTGGRKPRPRERQRPAPSSR